MATRMEKCAKRFRNGIIHPAIYPSTYIHTTSAIAPDVCTLGCTKQTMGTLETEVRYQRRKGYLQHAVLGTVAVAGILAVAMVAPNVLQLLGGMTRGKKRFGEQARSAIGRLVDKGYVTFEGSKGNRLVRITQKGKQALLLEERKAVLRVGPMRPKRWDRRWRMVVFDVPEYRKPIRNRLRNTMREFGFLRVQDSVWVYPYDCEDLMALLKADLRIGKDVLYAVVEKIENDAWIKKLFGLVGY